MCVCVWGGQHTGRRSQSWLGAQGEQQGEHGRGTNNETRLGAMAVAEKSAALQENLIGPFLRRTHYCFPPPAGPEVPGSPGDI